MQDCGAAARPAFTLVELVVVVGIIVLLAAIVLPTASGLVQGSKAKQTLGTMKVLESAIAQFVSERALQGDQTPLRGRPYLKQPDGPGGAVVQDWTTDQYADTAIQSPVKPPSRCPVFGPFPGSPTACFAPNPGQLREVAPAWARAAPYFPVPQWTGENDSTTAAKFLQVLLPLFVKQGKRATLADPAPQDDFHSVECLLLCLNIFSPEAKRILGRLPSGIVTNRDQDFVYQDANDDGRFDTRESRVADLQEVVDAWGKPMRYGIRVTNPDMVTGKEVEDPQTRIKTLVHADPVYQWELRSAGPDGQFAAMFTAEDASDDVILRGS